jgi:hypothetical protein
MFLKGPLYSCRPGVSTSYVVRLIGPIGLEVLGLRLRFFRPHAGFIDHRNGPRSRFGRSLQSCLCSRRDSGLVLRGTHATSSALDRIPKPVAPPEFANGPNIGWFPWWRLIGSFSLSQADLLSWRSSDA